MADLVLAKEQLQAGDVLLFHGKDWICAAIRLFDGTEVSQAGVYRGPGLGAVAEAIGAGVVSRVGVVSVTDSDRALVFRDRDRPADAEPLTSRVDRYLAERRQYAYEKIVFPALRALTRRVRVSPFLREILRRGLDAASARLVEWIDAAAGRETMICPELADRAYDEALQPDVDAFSIVVEGTRIPLDVGAFAPTPAGGGLARCAQPGSILDFLACPRRASGPRGFAPGRPAAPEGVPGEHQVEAISEALGRAAAPEVASVFDRSLARLARCPVTP